MKKEQINLQEEIATMKIMLYSLHNSIDDICYGLTKQHIKDIGKWEKECRKEAKKLLKENKNEIKSM